MIGMPKTTSFSIVTSTYNQLEKLKRLREYLDQQSYFNFEWIIADDGSNDGTRKWAKKNADKYVWQEDRGYRLTKILNKAGDMVEGDNIVWIMADSFPDRSFLKVVNNHIKDDILATGIRLNISDGAVISDDWRLRQLPDVKKSEVLFLNFSEPWKLMTLNSMIMPKPMWENMGGIDEEYDEGYGRMDWWMAMWAYYNNYQLAWFPQAILFHDFHESRSDTRNNIALFEKHREEFENA